MKLDSLFQSAAGTGDGLAQVHAAFVLNPIGRQVDELQGRVLLQHTGQMESAVTGHTVTENKNTELCKSLGLTVRQTS